MCHSYRTPLDMEQPSVAIDAVLSNQYFINLSTLSTTNLNFMSSYHIHGVRDKSSDQEPSTFDKHCSKRNQIFQNKGAEEKYGNGKRTAPQVWGCHSQIRSRAIREASWLSNIFKIKKARATCEKTKIQKVNLSKIWLRQREPRNLTTLNDQFRLKGDHNRLLKIWKSVFLLPVLQNVPIYFYFQENDFWLI